MSRFTLSPVRVVILSLLGTLIIGAGAIAAVIALWQPTPLEGMLPAQGTIALFGNATREDLRLFTGRFPSLQNVPLFSGTLSVGILRLPAGKEAWVLSATVGVEHAPPLPENIHIGRQGFTASDPGVELMMAGEDPRLRTSGEFIQLTRGMDRTKGRWIFLSDSARAQNVVPGALEQIVDGTGALLLSSSSRGVTLRLKTNSHALADDPISQPLPILSPAPDFSIALAHPDRVIDQTAQLYPEPERTLRMAVLRGKAQALLGGDWSWTYDILPLLQRESLLSWTSAQGRTPASFLLRGSIASARDGRERLDAMHERMRSKLVGSVVTRRTFEKGFVSEILKSDPSQVEDVQEVRSGWNVHITRERGGSGALLSATRGTQFIITNVQQWLDQALRTDRMMLPRSPSGHPMAGGTASVSGFAQWTSTVAKTPEWAWMMSSLHAQNGILWGIESDGQGETLSLTLSPL